MANLDKLAYVYDPSSPLLAVPNVIVHPSTASVPITVLLYDGPLLCGFNVRIKGLIASSVITLFLNVNSYAKLAINVKMLYCSNTSRRAFVGPVVACVFEKSK